nr:substrate-binding domain-containing protein [Herbaspirillum sp. ASV7]
MHYLTKTLSTAAVACMMTATTLPARAAEIHVLATGALSAAFKKLVPAFEKKSGDHLVIAWGPSYGSSADALPTRIRNKEPMDLCFMIGAALDGQIQQGVFDPVTRADLAQSRVGVAVRAGLPVPDVSSVEKLRTALLEAKSVAFSEGASGTFIVNTLFPKLGIVEQMKSKSVLIHGKELVGTAIERGEADLGLQQISELRAIAGIQFAGPLPDAVQNPNVIAAAIARDAKERKAAQGLIDYLRTAEAKAIFESTGLDPVSAR